jgi:hypothetical protein
MRDDYKLNGKSVRLEGVDIEATVAETLSEMEGYTKLTRSELVNTALKRFISHHKDFLPPEHRSSTNKKS